MEVDRPFNWHLRRRSWIAVDLMLSAAAMLLAYALQPGFVFGWESSNPAQLGAFQAALIYPWFVVLSAHVAGLQDPLGDRRRWFALLRVMLAVASALGLCILVLYFISLQQLGRTILIRALVLSIVFLGGARTLLWSLASTAPRKIGFLMSKERGGRLTALIGRNQLRFELVGAGDVEIPRAPDEIAEFFVREKVDEVVATSREDQRDAWLACLNRGVQVTDMAVFVEREYYKVACDDIDLAWFLAIDLQWRNPIYHRLKRIIDMLVSGLGMLLTAPIVALAGLAAIVESGCPAFYTQTRVGFRGKPYRLWKLRTMQTDAERDGAQWAKHEDHRITRVGRVLRRTRIDELPQLWNVLKGDMSMIGPRPERPEFVDKLAAIIPMYHQRHWTKPGITGWAQINYPYGASIADAREKLCYDLYYLKNASLLLDLHIGLRTIGAVMQGSR
jgi:exopolysaccharide biosynthesis polyprenyl glycosylphosphotransferase